MIIEVEMIIEIGITEMTTGIAMTIDKDNNKIAKNKIMHLRKRHNQKQNQVMI